MKILLTGATGYIGKRLLPVLLAKGYHVICGVRDRNKFHPPESFQKQIEILEINLAQSKSLQSIPVNIDIAYYLVHSMTSEDNYDRIEQQSAIFFRERMNQTKVKQVIFLSGITNAQSLSKHLNSRRNVELELGKGNYALTTLRAGIIIGSGSASFEIIRDLVEKLPIMIAPKWLKTKCQPIAISNVIQILTAVCDLEKTFNNSYDISGNEILTYKEILLQFAEKRGLKRLIFTVPVMTPKLSSYWLFFITSTSYKLARSLVDSMKIEVIAQDNRLISMLNIHVLTYKESIDLAFKKIEENEILSSWKDSTISGNREFKISDYIQVPTFGTYQDTRISDVIDETAALNKIWCIGGENGWYFADFLWRIRGVIDKLFGGVGLRRGRTNATEIEAGDSLDFWRVLYANKDEKRLLLFAEMKLPGDAWLEFRIQNNRLIQTATFRPKGLLGRLYWFAVLPFHELIFRGLIKKLVQI